MALAGAGRLRDTRAVIDRLDSYVGRAVPSSNLRMTAEVGLPACRSVLAYAEDRHADVVDELMPIWTVLARFGGSHAQRDALQRTLVVSAIRCAGSTWRVRCSVVRHVASRLTFAPPSIDVAGLGAWRDRW